VAVSSLASAPAAAFEYYVGDGVGVQIHGAYEMQLRTLADGFREDHWYLSQWSNVLNVELEFDIAPDGFLFFDQISGYARVEGRFECVYKSACGLSRSMKLYGDRAERQPPNFTDGTTSGFSGSVPRVELVDGELQRLEPERLHGDGGRLLTIEGIPPFNAIFELGSDPAVVERILEPFEGAVFAVRKIDHDNPYGPRVLPQGPWRTGTGIRNVGVLSGVPNFTNPADPDPADDDPRGALLLRPRFDSLSIPSQPLLGRVEDFDSFDQRFSENELFWNRGASQDEGELKEAYLDIELFDYRLWLRLGKQTIVWGKTELFRTTDQLNPQDIAISSLPSLEESRIALWSARGVWSFYDVGPLQDVRLEGAVILDDFEPTDLGFCGEPYTPFLVCGKSFGLFAHGITGLGPAGEERPPNFWDDLSGLEVGVRLEWRWNRFSFALVDFWGYSDTPYLETFHLYERAVDPDTGRPLDLRGQLFDVSGIGDLTVDDRDLPDTPTGQAQLAAREELREQAGTFQPANRQLFDLVCGVTVGVGAALVPGNPAIADSCVLDVLNNRTDLQIFAGLSAADGVGIILGGTPLGAFVAEQIVGSPVTLAELNQDPNDVNPLGADPPLCANNIIVGGTCVSNRLTDQQEALLGCGPFYGTHCDKHGIDLFNAEFSVLGQALPNVEDQMPVGTRVVRRGGQRQTLILPGARGPGDPGYDPLVDGCIQATAPGTPCESATSDLASSSLVPGGFSSEMEAVSFNFLQILLALGVASDSDEDCQQDDPLTEGDERLLCDVLRGVAALSGVQRPEVSARRNDRFGRRDFIWHGGGEAVFRYDKRNVLGFSMDFAEDWSKTNWSFEFTWIEDQALGSTRVRRGFEETDLYNFTVSVDRLTFIRFLNPNRTFFFNSQWFVQFIEDYDDGSRRFAANGPVSVLGTFSVGTAYFQDRLAPSLTLVHDFPSASGGVIGQISYRYTERFSVSVGAAGFYGGPRRHRISDYPLSIGNQAPPYLTRTNYQGLSAISERDEVFARLRYTF